MTAMVRVPELLKCDACDTPALRVVGNAIVIEHRHHGNKHTTVIAIADLLDKAAALRVSYT